MKLFYCIFASSALIVSGQQIPECGSAHVVTFGNISAAMQCLVAASDIIENSYNGTLTTDASKELCVSDVCKPAIETIATVPYCNLPRLNNVTLEDLFDSVIAECKYGNVSIGGSNDDNGTTMGNGTNDTMTLTPGGGGGAPIDASNAVSLSIFSCLVLVAANLSI